jgi:methyl-accepting chemotaxis protein
MGGKVRSEQRHGEVPASVGTRIYAAIAVIAVLTVVATGVAFWSFGQVGQTMRELVEVRFPVVEVSFELADAAAASVAVAPRLADAENLKFLDEQMAVLASADQRMHQQVGKLSATAAADKAQIVAQIDRLALDVKEAYQTAKERLTLVANRRQRVGELVNVQEQLTQLFVAMADEALFDLTVGMETASAGPDPESLKTNLKSLSERELPAYGGTLAIVAETNQLYGLLREVAVLGSKELLVPSRERFTAISERLSKAMTAVEKSGENAKRRTVVERLLAFGTGDDNLFALREREFDTRNKLAQKLGSAVTAAAALQKEVQGLVVSARAATREASGQTGKLIANNVWLLAGISLLGICVALTIAIFYVRPRIVNRMRALWHTTQAIAEGRLDTAIDAKGRDEIADIARAVAIFRDSAIERERLTAESERWANEQRGHGEERERLNAEQVRAAEAESQRAARVNVIVEDFRRSIADILGELRGTSDRLGTAAVDMDNVSNVVSAEVRIAEEKMGVSSQHVSDTAGSTEDLARMIKRIEDEARKSNAAVSAAVQQFQRAVGTMSTLDDAASRIDEVVGLIQSIAGKTNLLALNAKIEAARAGEAGRGFSVVAEEVKSLAGQTAQATEDVTAQINAIQSAAAEARLSMGQLDAIIAQVSKMVESVAETVTEQSMSVASISSGANFASTEARSGSEAISRVASVSAGARTTAGEVKSLAGTVANDAERLDEHVDRFLQAVRAA